MRPDLKIRIILENPFPGIDFCIQNGRLPNRNFSQIQRSTGEDLQFDFKIKVKVIRYLVDFGGLFVQGSRDSRFFYLNMGTYAGEADSIWSKRIKIPFVDFDEDLVKKVAGDSTKVFVTHINGRAKDDSPASGTVKPFSGWQVEYNK